MLLLPFERLYLFSITYYSSLSATSFMPVLFQLLHAGDHPLLPHFLSPWSILLTYWSFITPIILSVLSLSLPFVMCLLCIAFTLDPAAFQHFSLKGILLPSVR